MHFNMHISTVSNCIVNSLSFTGGNFDKWTPLIINNWWIEWLKLSHVYKYIFGILMTFIKNSVNKYKWCLITLILVTNIYI